MAHKMVAIDVPDQRIGESRGETIFPESWFCTILPRSSKVTNITEQNTLYTNVWPPKLQFRSVVR